MVDIPQDSACQPASETLSPDDEKRVRAGLDRLADKIPLREVGAHKLRIFAKAILNEPAA